MRHTRVRAASYAIAGILALTAAAVGWARSRDTYATAAAGEAAPAEAAAMPVAAMPVASDSGAAVYARECRSCHGEGEARGRRIPPLRGLAVELLVAEGGREYLIDLMFDGRVRFEEDGKLVYQKTHPAYPHLNDAQVAAVLNHMLAAWGNQALLPRGTRPYTAAEVAGRRPQG
jgi:mono/diheme cytochrome c family protein